MKESLKPGITHQFSFTIPEEKTVPYLLRESEEFQQMPRVLATGFMVGLIEWTCIQATNPHIDWPREQTVGVAVDLTHDAPTPPGMTVTVRVRLEKVEGKSLTFSVTAHDGQDSISSGIHKRYVINADKFNKRVDSKAAV